MFELSIRAKSYLVIILMISCFGLLYPKILHPMILHLLGMSKNEPIQDDFIHPRDRHMRMEDARRSPRTGTVSPDKHSSGRSGSIMTMVLPVYAIGIVFYLIYTLVKVFGSDKSKNKSSKRDSILRNYYRDFHYDPTDGEFKLNYGTDGSPELIDDIDQQSSYRYKTPNDIYNCTKTLPHELEILLQKVDDKSISEDEMHQLRLRLEETESQLTRILSAMENLEQTTKEECSEQCRTHQDDDVYGDYGTVDNDETVETVYSNNMNPGCEMNSVGCMVEDEMDDEFYDCQLLDNKECVTTQRKVAT